MIEWTFSIHIVEAAICMITGSILMFLIWSYVEWKSPRFDAGWEAGYKYGKAEGVLKCKDCKYYDHGLDDDGTEFHKCIGPRYGRTKPNGFCDMGEPK